MQCDRRDVLADVTDYPTQPLIAVLICGSTTQHAEQVDLKPDFQVNWRRQ